MGRKTKAGFIRYAGCVGVKVNDVDKVRSCPPELVFVALGANLGDSKATIVQAARELQTFSDAPLLRSSLWETSPVDCPPGTPAFINAVIGLLPRVTETPETLLPRLQFMERAFGRQPKKILNESRPLDLDLIMFQNQVRSTQQLTLPHPRAHLRRFVLQPLNQIAPELILPGQSKTVNELLEDLPGDELMKDIRSRFFFEDQPHHAEIRDGDGSGRDGDT